MRMETDKFILLEKAHNLTIAVYETTAKFPKEEIYGVSSQMRRAAVSIPCNIVEGRAKKSSGDYRRFLLIARGSLAELEYLLLLSKDLQYLTLLEFEQIDAVATEVGKILNAVINTVAKMVFEPEETYES